MRHYISSYDLAADRLVMRCYRRKSQTLAGVLALPQDAAFVSTRGKCDCTSSSTTSHRTEAAKSFAGQGTTTCAWRSRPTYASWLNRIEPLFAALRYFALNNSDYQDHEETRRAINAYVAWRNRRPDNPKLRRLEKHKPTSGSRH